MGRFKQAVMAAQYDDMGDVIPEMEYINRLFEGIELPEVDLPEGYGGECNE